MIGKTRVGKSALINAYAATQDDDARNMVAIEGKNTTDISRTVESRELKFGNTKFIIWEAPGLQDFTESDSAVTDRLKSTLKGSKCSYINLVIYCTPMNRERFEQSEVNAINHITKAFGNTIWRNAVFALTYANRVLPPAECDTDDKEKEWFQSRIKEFENVITRILADSFDGVDLVPDVCVFPAGYHTATRRIQNPYGFYCIENWFSQFDKLTKRVIKSSPFLVEDAEKCHVERQKSILDNNPNHQGKSLECRRNIW